MPFYPNVLYIFFTSIDKLVKPDSIIEKWMTRISDFLKSPVSLLRCQLLKKMS